MLLFFDAGGTLIQPRRSVGEIYASRAADFGVRADAEQVEAGFRRAFAASPPLAFPNVQADQLFELEQSWWRDVVRAAFAEHRFTDFEGYFQALYREFAEPEVWQVFDDVVPVLEELSRRGVALGVISNFDTRLTPLFEGLGLARYFDSITVSSAAGWAKPDPRIFHHALGKHGVDVTSAVHIGDSQTDDVEGGQAAGWRAILVRSNGRNLLDVVNEL